MAQHILVVEDDERICVAIETALRSAGFRTLSATKATEAIRLLSNQKFDCILLDLHLERGTGESVLTYIRETDYGFNYRSPVFVISGTLKASTVSRIKQHVGAFFVKPFDVQALVAKVKETLWKQDPPVS